MLDDLFYADNLKAAQDAALRPPPVPKQAAGFSAWNTAAALPRGVVAGGAQSGGFFSDTLAAFGQALAGTGTASGQGMFSTQTDTERQQSDQQAAQIRAGGLDFSSATGDNLRGFARFLAPDPETAHTAERLVFDLSRVMTKAVGYSVLAGGPVGGAALTGADEGMTVADDLKQAGVDLGTRTAVGGVVGGFTGLGVLLPVAGTTATQTAGLVLAGGPLSFMAQQQAVRTILQAQDYTKLSEQYDPFDPVGLAVASLIPASFGAWGLRAARGRVAAEARAAEAQAARDFAAGPVPSEETAIARAAREATQEHVDAARVMLDAEQRRNSNPLGDDARTADAHEAAMSKAIDQLSTGERVSVDDLMPARGNIDPVNKNAAASGRLVDDARPDAAEGNVKLSRASLAEGEAFVRKIEALAEQHGKVYIRWSPTAERDLTGAQQSRDFVAGQMHEGLSAIEITADTHHLDIAKSLAAYGFLRMQDPKSRPRVYVGRRVGTDSDSHALIKPTAAVLEVPDSIIAAIDKNFDIALNLADDIRIIEARLAKITDAGAIEINKRSLAIKQQELSALLSESSSPSPLGEFSARIAEAGRAIEAELPKPTAPKEPTRAAEPAPKPAAAEPTPAAPATPARAAAPAAGPDGARPAAANAAAGLVEDAAAAARVEQVKAEAPDLMVQLDGMDAPMRVDELLAAVKAEADDLVLDGELMQAAAECALRVGA